MRKIIKIKNISDCSDKGGKHTVAELELNKIVEEAKNHPGITTVLTTSAAGAAIGSVLPIVGTSIGLGIGAIIGGIGIIASELKKGK